MHFRRMMRHAESNVKMMRIVMGLWRLPMIMITTTVIIIILRWLALRIFLVLHSTILEPDFNLYEYENKRK